MNPTIDIMSGVVDQISTMTITLLECLFIILVHLDYTMHDAKMTHTYYETSWSLPKFLV